MAYPDPSLPVYEVYAIRYAKVARRRRDNLIGDPHDAPMPMDFFVWMLRSGEQVILVDTGFTSQTATSRQRNWIGCPIDTLALLGVAPAQIKDVVLTHLHYDHAGNLDMLPNATFHVQDAEVDFATGRCMCHHLLRHAYAVEDIVTLVRRVYDGRVVFHDGDHALFPAVQLLKIGGHSRGLQSVRVHTARGWVVLASDASHYYENMEKGLLFPIVYNAGEMLAGHKRVMAVADSPEHVVPGHDPLVLTRYPSHAASSDIAILHQPPRGAD